MKHITRLFVLMSLVLLAFNHDFVDAQYYGNITRVDEEFTTSQFNQGAFMSEISNNGEAILFLTNSTNLGVSDTNNGTDVYIHFISTGGLRLITRSRNLVQGNIVTSNGSSNSASISDSTLAQDIYVVFSSFASDIINGDTNNTEDLFLYHPYGITRISLDYNGNQITDFYSPSKWLDISDDGRYVVFDSTGVHHVPNDTNNAVDVFMYDHQTAQTQRISLDSNGNQTGGGSHPKISDDGRYVLFTSSASDLVPDDTNNAVDVFVRDLQTGQTKRVSVDSNGNQLMNSSQTPITLGQDISPDGRYILFESNADNLVPNDTNNQLDVFRHDTLTGETILISVNSNGVQANGDSGGGKISDDGRFVYFQSVATNLVVNDTNNVADVFKRDTQTNITTRLGEIQTNGASGTISTASDYVVFSSDATNLVSNDTNNAKDIFAYHNQFRTFTRLATYPYTGRTPLLVDSFAPHISNDGRYVVFISDDETNIYFYDSTLRRTRKITNFSTPYFVDSASISGNNRYIVFTGTSQQNIPEDNNGVSDIFLYDLQTRATTRISNIGVGISRNAGLASISHDGRYIAYIGVQSNAVSGIIDSDVYLYDTQTAQTSVITNILGSQYLPYIYVLISDNGRYIVYETIRLNYQEQHLFIYDTQTQTNKKIVSMNRSYSRMLTSISDDGRYISLIGNQLIPDDTTTTSDVYLYDQQTEQIKIVSVDSSGVQLAGPTPPCSTMSGDGQVIFFALEYTYAYIHHVPSDKTTLVSPYSWYDGGGDWYDQCQPNISLNQDGSKLAFSSSQNRIVPYDIDFISDIFIQEIYYPPILSTPNLSSPTDSLTTFNRIFDFNWDTVTDATHYQIQIMSSTGNIIDEQWVNNITTNYTFSQSGTYRWRVRAYSDINGYSSWSSERLLTIRALSTPNLLSPNNYFFTIEPEQLFSWSSITGAVEYQLQIATDNEFTQVVHEVTTSNTNHIQNFSVPDTYFWRVRGKSDSYSGWSQIRQLTVYNGEYMSIDEQQLFNMAQPELANGMTFALFDVIPTGIITTTQFDDGGVVTGAIHMTVQNGLLLITVDGLSGGSTAQQDIFRDSMPAMIMNMLDEMLPDGYLAIETVTMTDMGLNIGLVMPNP